MKSLAWVAIGVYALLLSSCVAGAAREFPGVVHEAKAFPTTVARGYRVEAISTVAKEQHIARLLAELTSWTEINREGVEIAPGVAADFRDGRYTVRYGGVVAFEHMVPAAFRLHPIEAAYGRLGDFPVLISATKARATTGLYWIAVNDRRTGEVIYRAVLPAGEVWDIENKNGCIDILGATNGRRLSVVSGLLPAPESPALSP